MSDDQRESRYSAALEAEAAQWLARMEGDRADLWHDEFQAWLAAAPEHADVYGWVKRAESRTRELPLSEKFRREADEAAAATRPPAVPERPRRASRLVGYAAAAALVLTIGIASLPPGTLSGWPFETAASAVTLMSRRGEILAVRIADGSMVTLDTDTRVEMRMNRRERVARIAQGRARFDIVADPRPFRVEAGAGTISTTQAVFDVDIDYGRPVLVHVVSGAAEVRATMQPAVLVIPVQSIAAGKTFAYTADRYRPTSVPREVSAMDRSQWPDGWVDCRSITLGALVAEANRYAVQPIVIDDPAVAQLEATGRFKVSDPDGFVRKIAEPFDLVVDRRPDGIHLRRK